jgi:putative heme-binding domain-containing protein
VLTSAVHHGAAVTASAAPAGRDVLGRAADALLPAALVAGDRGSIALLLEAIVGGSGPLPLETTDLLRRFLVLLSERGTSLSTLQAAQPPDRLSAAAARAKARINESRGRAADPSIRPADRIAAAALLAAEVPSRPGALASLAGWLDARHPPAVQAAAARALAATAAAEIPTLFAAAWSRLGPAGRDATLAGWLGRGPWAVDLLERVERGEIPPAAFDTTQRGRLLRHESREVQRLAQKAFGGAMPTRVAVIERYVPALALNGDAARGRELYRAACSACHKRGEEGRDVGPDLASVTSHTPERLLSSILDPNADIQPGYAAFTCTLQDGEQAYGLIVSETAGSVTLKLLDGSRRTFRRNEIASLEGGAASLMPEGLESAIQPQGLADLIAFLRGPLR